MSLKAPLDKYDGFQMLAGVDSGRMAHVLDRTQLAWLVNGITRGGAVQCRPGWSPRVLSFVDEFGAVDTVAQARFETGGRWQGAASYDTTLDDGSSISTLVCSIGGRIFSIPVESFAVQDLTSAVHADTNNPAGPMTWMTQAETYLVIQNGEDQAFVYDGTNLKRSVAAPLGGTGIPVGSCMAYNNGRLWVARPGGHSFVAGDLAYAGKTGTPADLLEFTENTFLAGGGEFVVSTQAGPIRAMCSIAAQDNTTGQGPLQVITTRASFSINAPFDRTQWQTTTSPIETISMLASGAVSQLATVNINGDIWFRSPDGVRSFMIARRDHGTWVNTPISNEMIRSFNYDTNGLLEFASAVQFDNRFLVTSQPEIVKSGSDVRGIVHRTIGVLDFYPISSMAAQLDGSSVQPEWQGIWTGLRILQLVTTGTDVQRCFAFVLDATNKVALWELSRTDRFDNGDSRIAWFFETPSYGFDDGGWVRKRLHYGDVWFDRRAGQVDYNFRYREDSNPFWNDWAAWGDCATVTDCDIEQCGTPSPRQEQYKSRQRLPEPDNTADAVTGDVHPLGYRFQVRVDVNGFVRFRQLRLVAQTLPEDVTGESPTTTDCGLVYAGCISESDISYTNT